MRWKIRLVAASLGLLLGNTIAWTQPSVLPPSINPPRRPTLEPPVEPPTTTAANLFDAAGCGPDGCVSSRWRRMPTMFGDLPYVGQDRLVAPSNRLFPIALDRGAYKIAENEAVLPQDRVFASYNYYHNIAGPRNYLHRETIGFEKTFLNGNASIGMRLPFYQLGGDNGTQGVHDVGDLTVIFKAIVFQRPDHFAVTSGLAVTAPTGGVPSFELPDGTQVHSTLLQPYVGYLWSANRFYLHGFSSIMIPTDSRDVTVAFNDIGIGYWLYENESNRLLRAVVPTFEAHFTNPLNQRSVDDIPRFRDGVNLTGGMTLVFRRGSSLGVAAAFPVMGPRPFEVEGLVNFNFRY